MIRAKALRIGLQASKHRHYQLNIGLKELTRTEQMMLRQQSLPPLKSPASRISGPNRQIPKIATSRTLREVQLMSNLSPCLPLRGVAAAALQTTSSKIVLSASASNVTRWVTWRKHARSPQIVRSTMMLAATASSPVISPKIALNH